MYFFLFIYYFTISDINECDDKELNDCTSSQHCVNELGSYNCSCLDGHHSYGKACVPDQFGSNDSSLTIKLTVGKYIYLKVMSHMHSTNSYSYIKKKKLVSLELTKILIITNFPFALLRVCFDFG